MTRPLLHTYFALSPDGTFYETTEGRQSFDAIGEDIATGACDVSRVFVARDGRFEDVTEVMADYVYDLVRKRNAESGFIPSFLSDDDRDFLREGWKTPAQKRADRADNRADLALAHS